MYYCNYERILQCKATQDKYFTKDYISNGIRSRPGTHNQTREGVITGALALLTRAETSGLDYTALLRSPTRQNHKKTRLFNTFI